MTNINTLTRQLDQLVHRTADKIGNDCREALETEADLYRVLARHCAERIAQAKALGLYIVA